MALIYETGNAAGRFKPLPPAADNLSMDWTLTAGIGLTIWATLILLSNERSAMETIKRATPVKAEAKKPETAAARK